MSANEKMAAVAERVRLIGWRKPMTLRVSFHGPGSGDGVLSSTQRRFVYIDIARDVYGFVTEMGMLLAFKNCADLVKAFASKTGFPRLLQSSQKVPLHQLTQQSR